jgi:hypothetical protein
MDIIKDIILAALLIFCVHEGGHYITALITGCKPKFEFLGWVFAVAFWCDTPWKRTLITEAGFGAEMIVGVILTALLYTPGTWVDKQFLVAYLFVSAIHFWTYPWRAQPETNDFNGMCSHSDGYTGR